MEDFTYHFVALVVLAAGLAAVAIKRPGGKAPLGLVPDSVHDLHRDLRGDRR